MTTFLDLDSDDLALLNPMPELEQLADDDIDPTRSDSNPLACDHADPCLDADRWIQVHCYDCGQRLARPVHVHCFE